MTTSLLHGLFIVDSEFREDRVIETAGFIAEHGRVSRAPLFVETSVEETALGGEGIEGGELVVLGGIDHSSGGRGEVGDVVSGTSRVGHHRNWTD